ncbi:CLUMA_CG006981, isoform A [Clunio marinus]|uniref:CLUMA_CG006981, isoform A n=1 Tax=Clunio marinus TaxID=568069 RepID=A0A1J1HZJ6_9DIPT|nr:CLUMA_CG006981, isoform A [Clunio marinus]
MQVLSVTNHKTHLHTSESDLSIVCSKDPQIPQFSSDAAVFKSSAASKCFVQIHKSELTEVWRLKRIDGIETFDRIRKTKTDGVQSVCCSKNKEGHPEYAIGYNTGQIKVIELNEKNNIIATFKPEPNNKASVISVDFSSCGGFLSSVYENGHVSIFGLQTKVKTANFRPDKETIIARFHPGRRLPLAMASFTGAVMIYDIASRSSVYEQRHAHRAPCSDIAMCEDAPNWLFSCGYDSKINIFDTRTKKIGQQIHLNCGLCTMSVPKCGSLFVVGNLKGDVITFDVRHLTRSLSKKNVGTEPVTRVHFMSLSGDSSGEYSRLANMESIETLDLSEVPGIENDVTMEIEELSKFRKGQISDLNMSCSSRVSLFRAEDEESYRESVGRRESDLFGRRMENVLKDLSFKDYEDCTETESPKTVSDESNVNQKRGKSSAPKRRSSHLPSPLHLIREESDKENTTEMLKSPAVFNELKFSSTPETVKKVVKDPIEVIDLDTFDSPVAIESNKKKPEGSAKASRPSTYQNERLNFKKELEEFEKRIHEKMKFELQMLDFDINGRHVESMFHITNQRAQLQNRIDMIENCMGILMNEDFKIQRIMEVEAENRELRKRLDDVLKQFK